MSRKSPFSLSTLPPSKILTDIQNKRCFESFLRDLRSNTPDSAIFLHKVSKREAPTYYDVIQNPMDLGTMNKKLPLYDTRSFCDDLDLIWENCFYFNRDSPFFVGCAERMKAKADSLKSFYFGDEDFLHWTQFREFASASRIERRGRIVTEHTRTLRSLRGLHAAVQCDIVSRNVVRVFIARVLRASGFGCCTKSTLDILTDVFVFYTLKRVASLFSVEHRSA